ncbi:MAG: glycosyltransferase [Anaerolineae bacterium]|nr:glycosyltransferase [Anaerolineae bacterium]
MVNRLLQAVAQLNYPQHLLTIQVLDDSTDDTSTIVAEQITELQNQGIQIQHIRRDNRIGYKAGALAYGLSLVDCEYAAIFDADFIPPPDFLLRTIPHLVANPRLGMVQTRWGHLNPFANPLTMGQSLALDGHFVVEQTARCRSGLLMNFNGSGGVWRVTAIHKAGGWRHDTLTEDLDLSYRAQLAGWQFLYLPDVTVNGELPPQITAYKQQQARWAQGSTETLVQVFRPLWHTRLPLSQRVMATIHLCQYLPHPLMVSLLLLTPPLMLGRQLYSLPLGPLGAIGLATPMIYVVSQYMLYTDWWRRLLAFPMLLALGTGIAWNNTCAVVNALVPHHQPAEFHRTPKFSHNRPARAYALRANHTLNVELILAIYAFWGASLAMERNPALVPFLGLYGFAFGLVSLWSMYDYWVQARS